ncbi:MAG: Ig-like domain-containing protein [Luteolibacter sp.]|uniref:discoidin domain-containing protein n=1 Tax=Luteolibacter sp. TaxID=1962973 RepID=UPI003266D63C
MKISRLASPAKLGGALHPRLCSFLNPVASSIRAQTGPVHARLAWIALAAICLMANSFAATAPAVNLAWNANPESDITGYRVSYGSQSGVYPNAINVSTNPTASISGLAEGSTYYFVVAAVNQAGLQGPASSEVSYQIPNTVLIPSTGWTLKYADSQESLDYQAAYAFDNDPGTIWHTSWSESPTPPPHEIQINLGTNQSISGFRYLPRSGSFLVGNVGQYEFYVSLDGVNWGTPVATGTFANTHDLKEVRFPETTGKFIRLRSITDASGGTYMSAAEIYLIQGSSTPAANHAPVSVSKSLTTSESTSLAVTLSGTDADGNALTYSVLTNPANGALSGTAPNLTYYPFTAYTGGDSFTYRVNDGTVDSATATVLITVTPVNHTPVAIAKSVTTSEDTALSVVLEGIDSDNNSLTYNVVSGPAHGSLGGAAPNLTYTPAANYTGTDSFTFRVNDGTSNSTTATVSISVSAVNDAPVAISKSVTTAQDGTLPITLTGTDIDGNAVSFSIVTGPANGTLGGTAPNLTYQPAAGYSGADSFTFKANDGTANSATATVSITITPVIPETGVSVLARTGWTLKSVDSQEIFDSPGSYAFDGNPATFWHTQWRTSTLPTLPHEIQINLGAVQNISGFKYLPRQDGLSIGNIGKYQFFVSLDGVNWGNPVATGTFANSSAEKQVTFSTKSGQFVRLKALTEVNGTSDTCVAELNILKGPFVNQPPLAVDQSVTTESDTPTALTLSGSDPEGTALTFSVVAGPTHGILTGTAPNLTYIPEPDYIGSDQFTFRSNDGAVYSEAATVLLTVTPVAEVPGNFAPAFPSDSIPASATENESFLGQLVATDENPGDVLIFRKLSGPAWLTISPEGALGGTPLNSNVGINTFTVKVADQFKASATATLIVTVANTNNAPVFKLSPIIYPAGTEKVVYRDQTLASIAFDPDLGDSFSYSKTSGPEWLSISPNGLLKGTPPGGSAGLNQFTIRATDLAGAFSEETLQIKINLNTLPLPWRLERVGTGNLAGPARYAAGVFTVGGSGALDEKSDAGNFGWQNLSGDGQITACIEKIDDTGADTRVGLMIRDSLAADSRQVFIGVNGNGDLRWLRRSETGATARENSLKSPEFHETWLKLVRDGDNITAFKSKNGNKWTKAGTIDLNLPENCYIGLSVSSGDKDLLNTSKFSHVRVTP